MKSLLSATFFSLCILFSSCNESELENTPSNNEGQTEKLPQPVKESLANEEEISIEDFLSEMSEKYKDKFETINIGDQYQIKYTEHLMLSSGLQNQSNNNYKNQIRESFIENYRDNLNANIPTDCKISVLMNLEITSYTETKVFSKGLISGKFSSKKCGQDFFNEKISTEHERIYVEELAFDNFLNATKIYRGTKNKKIFFSIIEETKDSNYVSLLNPNNNFLTFLTKEKLNKLIKKKVYISYQEKNPLN